MLKTREQFFDAIERYERQLSPEQEAAEQKALSGEAMDFRPALAETMAQARRATEAFGEMVRRAADAGKWIGHVQRDLTNRVVTLNNSLALPRGLFEPPSGRLSLPEIAEPFIRVRKSLEHLALSTAAVTKRAVNLAQCATLELTKNARDIFGIPSPLESFGRLCEGFSPPKTPKLTRRSNGRPNYIEYASEIDRLPTTGFWSFRTASIQFCRNSSTEISGSFPMTA